MTTRNAPIWLRSTLVTALACGAAVTAASDDDTESPAADAGIAASNTIVDIALADADFSILVAALQKAELVETLQADGAFTVFAPTNAAFEASGITSIDDISKEDLAQILLYHVIAGADVRASDVTAGPVETAASLTAFLGTEGGVTLNGGNAITGGANVAAADVIADNGVIHVIDRVLLPPDITGCATYGGLDSLVGAVGAAAAIEGGPEVIDVLQSEGPFTVFAPTNDAFAAITVPDDTAVLRDILLYHALGAEVGSAEIGAKADSLLANQWGNGVSMLFDTSSGVAVNGADVVIADIHCTNGTVHVIDDVLLPPNVVDMAVLAGFTSLVGAVGSAADIPGSPSLSVADALAADAPYTIFAPTNDAFAQITVPTDTSVLRDVLLLHVVQAGEPVLSSGLPGAPVDSLLSGEQLSFDAGGPSVSSDSTAEAGIALPDINVTNGVIHVVDKVLLP